jgi:magnesium transporter
VSSQQNIDNRKISAVAALLSVPAVLAGLAGMNFKNLPGASWDYGWEALVALILIIDTAMFLNFKRRNWL